VGTSYNGLRTTSASANILHRNLSKLTVWTNSAVTKVLFEDKKAAGIQIDGGMRGKIRQCLPEQSELTGCTAFAKREIILTAGAIDTPKLLLLSGVGPAQELQQKAIPVIHDLPGVGKNLQDHNGVFVIDLLTSEFSSRGAFTQDPDQVEAAREQWTKDRTGPFNHQHGTVTIGFVKDEQIYETDAFKELDNATQELLRDPVVPTFELATV
jgi:choline dehydrogenase-like flavoprotein